MQKITPHLWFDKEAEEAAKLYTSIFHNSKIKNITTIHNTPSGDSDIVTFDLAGQEFMAISAGPLFKFNPSISFFVTCASKGEVETLWKKLSQNGNVMMELGEYPFSELYGWTEDRYGLSWQIGYMGGGEIHQKITPTLMFTGNVCGKAQEAIRFYASMFNDSKINNTVYYSTEDEPDKEGTVKYVSFTLEGQDFAAMDSARAQDTPFNEAISLMVYCKTQEEIDFFWNKLSAVPEAEACGWLKDKYGLSWQIVPAVMDEMMTSKDPQKIARVTEAFLKMKKFDIEELKKAYSGK